MLKIDKHGSTSSIERDGWFLGSIGKYGGGDSFMCQHGSLVGHTYSAEELREIADKIDGAGQKKEVKSTLRFTETGAGLIVKKKGQDGYVGRIIIDGRRPGSWVGSRENNSVSPEEMAEIAQKCTEIKRQVESTRNLRKTLLK